ncbi:heat shock protein transcriptional repressor HspR [Streptacidiphilus carbonis]|jgi:MerR family transcriptional regulator, heat shock protein HspR|uniref:heat shock protein transcriptional repressor HspR n=1 Tax=Streptacidiphilus carbonis TaxID=105422 RepID=UPI000A05D2B0
MDGKRTGSAGQDRSQDRARSIGVGLGDGLPGGVPGPGRGRGAGRGGAAYQLTELTPVYVISVAAQLSGLHPQTLRQYDRLGLVCPDRTAGRGRRYSARDIQQLREVQRLSQEEGINLAGIKRIIELENQVTALQARVAELQGEVASAGVAASQREAAVHASYRRDLVPYQQVQASSALVVWRPKR